MAEQSKALKPAEEIRQNLQRMEPQFKMALPSHISPEKFVRVVQTAVANNPHILKADRTSLYAACMKAAQDGLLPDGKEAALVSFKDQVQYMPMVTGILKKIRNSGELASITSQVVFENDQFEFWVDADGEHLEHRPKMFGERGEPTGVYALAKLKDGSLYVEVLTKEQVQAIKSVSRGANNGPWAGPFASEMWRKSAIRRLAKRLPSSTDLDQVFEHDNETYDFNQTKASEEPKQKRKSRMEEAIALSASDIDQAVTLELDDSEVVTEEAKPVV